MGKRVLLFPLPYQGHINPMLELAALLHSRGFSITIFHTTFNSIDSTKYPSYRFILVEDGEIANRFTSTVDDTVHRIIARNNSCEQLFYDCLTSVLSEKNEEPNACLIMDMHWYNLQYLAIRLGVPTLILRTGSAATLNWFRTYPQLVQKGFIPVQESQSNMPVIELAPLRMGDLICVGNCNHEVLRDLLTHEIDAVRTSSGVIVNTFDAIESTEVEKFQKAIPVPVFCIGPLHKFTPPARSSLLVPDHTCLEWLDTQVLGSVLYVSFGSLACMNYEEFSETAWGVANSDQPFLWVVRPGSILGKDEVDFPDGFIEATNGHGKIVSWAPQLEVLAHAAVGAFWTHNGWNSTLEAICEGVPMICRPQFSDQMGNARYVTEKGFIPVQGVCQQEMELYLPPNQERSVNNQIWRLEYNPETRRIYLRGLQFNPQTGEALIYPAAYSPDVEAQTSESVGLEVRLSGRTNHQIPLPEHRTGRLQGHIAVDVEAQMSDEVNPPLNNIDQFSGLEMSPPQSTEQNTGTVEYIVDLIFNLIGSNRIRRLKFLAGLNLVSNTAVGVYNLLGDLDGVDDTFWRAQLIASVGAPIAVSVFTLLSTFRFASDPERWSNWITGLSSVNGSMIAGGPLAFYFMRNRSTQ